MYEFIERFTKAESEKHREMLERRETEDAFNELRAEEKLKAEANCQSTFQAVPFEIIEEAGYGGATPFEEINGVNVAIRRAQSQDTRPAWGFSVEIEIEGIERSVEYATLNDESDLIGYADLQTGGKAATFEELLERDKELVMLAEELAEVLQTRFA